MPSETHPDWWRGAVIYQVYIRSFADGNGDGIGDIAGIRSRLPYLADLGVDAIWINPWYPSPMADAGYDVADYRDIEPRLRHPRRGRGADRRGARARPPGAPRHRPQPHLRPAPLVPGGAGGRSRVARSATASCSGPGADRTATQPPNDWQSVFGGPAWTRVTEPDGTPGQWYLHLFAPEQPDLNWEHPEVRAEFEDILRFWFDRGVDGFRIDVAHALVKEEGLPDADELEWPRRPVEVDGALQRHLAAAPVLGPRRVHEIYRAWRPIADSYDPPRVFVARGVGATSRSGSPATCARTSCTRRSTSTSSRRPGTRATSGT